MKNNKRPRRYWTLFTKSSYPTFTFTAFFKLRHPQTVKAMTVPSTQNKPKRPDYHGFPRFSKSRQVNINISRKQNGLGFARYRINEKERKFIIEIKKGNGKKALQFPLFTFRQLQSAEDVTVKSDARCLCCGRRFDCINGGRCDKESDARLRSARLRRRARSFSYARR